MSSLPHGRTLRVWLVELFAALNLVFLSIDIYLAHSANQFANRLEWIPIPFGLVALLLLPGLFGSVGGTLSRLLGHVVAWLSIALGLGGLLLHLESSFFEQLTIKSLVYTAPFVAPLAYVGVGMLLLINRMEARHNDWGHWVMILAAGGFLGNFALSLLDHAQNAFFYPAEWISVIAAAFGTAFFISVVLWSFDAQLRWWCGVVIVVEAIVGVLGAVLHLRGSLTGTSPTLEEQIIYGAPIFAPLLFTNLAILAALALWDLNKLHKQLPHQSVIDSYQ